MKGGKVLLAYSLVLLFLIGIFGLLYTKHQKNVSRAKQTVTLVPKAEESDMFSLSKNGQEITLRKTQSGGWVWEQNGSSGPAEKIKVSNFLASIGETLSAELVSIKEDGEEFGLGKEKTSVWVRVDSEKKPVFEFGNLGTDWQSTFVRMSGETEIWLLPRVLAAETNSKWWELEWLSNLPSAQITKVSIQKADTEVVYTLNSNGQWEDMSGANKHTGVLPVVEKLANLRAVNRIIDSKEIEQIRNSKLTSLSVQLTTGGGESVRLLVGPNWLTTNDEFYWAFDQKVFTLIQKLGIIN